MILVSRQTALADNQQGLLLKANKQTNKLVEEFFAFPKQAAFRHHCRRERHASLSKEDLSEKQRWEIWPKVHGYAVSDAAELLRLERLVGTCHAKLAKPNQNFTHAVSISAPGLMCQHEGSFDAQACS